MNNFNDDLDYIGQKKGISWFNGSLVNDQFFARLLIDIRTKRQRLQYPETTNWNLPYAMFPATDYLCGRGAFKDYQTWQQAITDNLTEFITLVAQGTQYNIPQRAIVILDYLFKYLVTANSANNIVELGCSGGAMGLVFENYQEIIWEKYFWLKHYPGIVPAKFDYQGCDLNIPDQNYLPYFFWNLSERAKVKNLLADFKLKGKIVQQSLTEYLDKLVLTNTPTFIITSYLLSQTDNPKMIYQQIMQKLNEHPGRLFWLDLSRKEEKLTCIFSTNNLYADDTHYLSINGIPKIESLTGSDWANWKEI